MVFLSPLFGFPLHHWTDNADNNHLQRHGKSKQRHDGSDAAFNLGPDHLS